MKDAFKALLLIAAIFVVVVLHIVIMENNLTPTVTVGPVTITDQY